MNIYIKSVAMVALLSLPLISFGQDSDLGNWLIYIGNKKVNSKWNVHHEVQYRNYNAIGDLEQLLLRTGMGYNLTENNNNVLLGYGFIHSQNYIDGSSDKVKIDEHRIFQQFITKQLIGKVGIQHRYRFEQRFVRDDFKTRFRYFLALTLPLTNEAPGNHLTYLSTYNEIFLNGEGDVFDRNRLYVGLGHKFSPNLRMELGYMNQFLRGLNRDQMNVFLFASF